MHLVDTTLFYSPTSGGVRRYLNAKHAWLKGRGTWEHTLLVPGDSSRLERGAGDLAFLPEFAAPPSLRRLRLPDAPFITSMRPGHPEAKRRLTLGRYLELGPSRRTQCGSTR